MIPDCQNAELGQLYDRYLGDQNTAAFLQAVSERYTVATLERLVTHPVRVTRRAATLALGMLGDYGSNAVLGRALVDEDRMVRLLAANGIRKLWHWAGTPAERQELGVLVRLNFNRQYRAALRHATALVTAAPSYAEAWNQRAIANYHVKRYNASVRDCRQALELNPYHFEAATGMGQSYLQLGRFRSALESLRRALKLNPDLDGVRVGVQYIERSLRRR